MASEISFQVLNIRVQIIEFEFDFRSECGFSQFVSACVLSYGFTTVENNVKYDAKISEISEVIFNRIYSTHHQVVASNDLRCDSLKNMHMQSIFSMWLIYNR